MQKSQIDLGRIREEFRGYIAQFFFSSPFLYTSLLYAK